MKPTYQNYTDRIVSIPGFVGGKPVIKGTRIPVETVLEHLAQDLNIETLFEAYPRLTKEDVKAVLHYTQVFFLDPTLSIAARQTLEAQRKKITQQQQTEHKTEDVLSLAGAWGERNWDEVEQELDRIRHESTPTPPIELDL